MSEDKVETGLSRSGIKALISQFRWLGIQAVLLFASAGHIDIPRAWIYFIYVFGAVIFSTIIFVKYLPELANQRGEIQEGAKSWDKKLILLYFFVTIIVIPVVVGLDVGRFGWSTLDSSYILVGICLYTVSYILIQWAMFSNTHFEGLVRIQKDRGHKVVSTGPYKYVRHPGYIGMILLVLSLPLVIGSIYGLIPAGIAIFLLIIRTSLEDKTLQLELDGYSEYAKKVKYRLLPGVW
ncbi:MAG: isoprenylcysteine carboxylmethyltransferase family protein [Halobacteriota archaeon]|nr:isoprenylcysteine carboxylmethyltransferase family protein [Halobacteriota archaeon]